MISDDDMKQSLYAGEKQYTTYHREGAWKGAEQHEGCGCKELGFHDDVMLMIVVVMLLCFVLKQNYDFPLHLKYAREQMRQN